MEYAFKYGWVVFIAVTYANAAIWWFRGTAARRQFPERTSSYIRIVWLYFAPLASLPWVFMGLSVITGEVSWMLGVMDLRQIAIFQALFYISLLVILACFAFYIWKRDGALELRDHPGLSNSSSVPMTTVLWKALSVFLIIWNLSFMIALYLLRDSVGPVFQSIL